MELAAHEKGTAMQIREIAEKKGISQNYLEQLLLALKKSGLLKSQRGVNGGYLLARDPKDIPILEVLETLEGPIEVLRERDTKGELDFFWNGLEAHMKKMLQMSLKDVITERDNLFMELHYSI